MEPVFKVTPENGQERDWQEMLDTAGNPWAELKIAIKIHNKMIDKLLSGHESEKEGISGWVDSAATLDNVGAVVSVLSEEIGKEITLPECYPNSMLCEMNWRPSVSESIFDNFFAENQRFKNSEFGYNAPTLSRYLTDYHMDRPYYGLPETGLFGGSSYNSPFNSSFSTSSGIDRLANMMSSNRSLGEFGFGHFYSPSRTFNFDSSASFGGFGGRW